jgi:hypothetical protein
MRAVWSFWSKPYLAGTGGAWPSPLHHLLAWGLSVRLGRAHYPQTSLVTDSFGAALLVDGLGLPFGSVSTALDCLDDADPALWMAGKLVTYGLQDAPFVHLDTDVFLWRALPAWLVAAPVFAQHLDEFGVTADCGPRVIESAFGAAGLALPVEWQWFRSLFALRYVEANLGIFGGTDIAFIRYYAALALDLALNPAHAAAWASIERRFYMNPTVEQFVFTACAQYHRFAPTSPYRGLHARYLFPTGAQAYDAEHARRVGYTHLLGPAKQHPVASARLLARMRSEDPGFYARCEAVSDGLAEQRGT